VTRVKATKLESLLKDVGQIDILSIDTEGTEIDAFESMDWEKHKPQILIIEFVTSGKVNTEIETYFTAKGYKCDGIVGANLIFHLPKPIVRDPYTLVYGSSYDRGLEHLLKMWPEIKKEVPQAKLRVFYGWNLFDKVYSDNPAMQKWKERMNELMGQEGIVHLGRISHDAVRAEMESAGVWAYPTHFGEISCITAMKAQAYGAIPVVINYAALSETVQYGIKVDGDIYDKEVKEVYLKGLVSLLKDHEQQEHIRPLMVEWAKRFSWENVAKDWDREFKSEKSLDKQVEEFLENNQALKAWELVKDTNWPKKDRLWLRVQHAFDPERYRKYYSEELVEDPISEQMAFQIDKVYPRYAWLVPQIKQTDTVLDLGCADGYLCLTLAKKGNKCTGVNLYEPSVQLANERAVKHKVPADFVCQDLMETQGIYDAVVLFEVLEHLPDPQGAIDHCMSLLNDGGRFYLSTPSPEHVGIVQHKQEAHGSWDDSLPSGHLRIFTEAELRELFKNYTIRQLQLDEEKCFLLEVSK
jgi:2-polyprenyl-3-methyl-5-hydroxy-6-metoxy-1,4-benzoquinol methylase